MDGGGHKPWQKDGMAGLRSFDFCDSLTPSHGGPQTAASPSAEKQDVIMVL